MKRLADQLDPLANYLGTSKERLGAFYEDLCEDTPFLSAINAKIKDLPQFEDKLSMGPFPGNPGALLGR